MEWVGVAEGAFVDPSELHLAARNRAQLRFVSLGDAGSVAQLDGCAALVVGLQRLSADHFAAMPTSVTVIGRAGIGLDSLDLDAARRRGIAVVHQPDYATDEVATHALAMILALSRRITTGDRVARSAWPSWSEFDTIRPLSESTVAVIGLGRIGRAVATRLAPLSGRVVGFDPVSRAAEIEQLGTLDEAVAGSDVVTLHAPLTEQTAAMINERTIELTAPGALLINVSRGGLVDEAAVARALRTGRLGGAALDVLSAEPPRADNPLLTTPNTILTPHMAWLSRSSQVRLQRWTMESVLDVLNGVPVTHGRLAVANPS